MLTADQRAAGETATLPRAPPGRRREAPFRRLDIEASALTLKDRYMYDP